MPNKVEVRKNSKVLPFARDVSYYFRKGTYYYQKNKWPKALLYFRKTTEVEPENPFNHYNLACLLSKMGRLKEANEIFRFIVTALDPSLTECYFLMAVNFGLQEDLEQAREYLLRYIDLDPAGDMVEEARELLLVLSKEGEEAGNLLTLEEKERLMKKIVESSQEELIEQFRENPSFRRILERGLYQAGDELKEDIIRFYSVLNDGTARRVLLEFVRNPWVKDRLRQVALLELKNMGVGGRVAIYLDHKQREINLEAYPLVAPLWREEWQVVLDCALNNMRRSACYDEGFYEDIQAIWIDFINGVYPDVPRIQKPETWAAGLEYSLARFHFLNLTQKELAEEYGVSHASVSSKYKRINQVLNIEHKAYQNMLIYLKDCEKDQQPRR